MTAWQLKDLERKGLRIREGSPVKTAECVTLTLPLPPTVNNAWVNVPGKGRVRSEGYRRWHKTAFAEMCLQKPGRIEGAFSVVINAGKVNRRCDIDNRIKGVLDLLKGEVVEDDSLCERVSAAWVTDVPAERVVVIVRKA